MKRVGLSHEEKDRLVILAKDGDLEARDALIAEVYPLIKQIARNHVVDLSMLDDLIQEGVLIAMNCIREYDPKGRANFSTYLGKALMRRYTRCGRMTALSMSPHAHGRYLRGVMSVECARMYEVALAGRVPINDASLAYYENFDRDDEEAAWRKQIINLRIALHTQLTARQREVVERIARGVDGPTIADELRVTRAAVSHTWRTALDKLKRHFGQEPLKKKFGPNVGRNWCTVERLKDQSSKTSLPENINS